MLSVGSGWSLDTVLSARLGNPATESGLADSGLVLRSSELRSRLFIDLLDLRSVIAETGSADGGTATTEANRGALVCELRAQVLDIRSAESVAEFGAEAAERRSLGAISEFGSVDTKAGLGSKHAELRLRCTESELDSRASVLEGAVVRDMGLLALSSLGLAIGASMMSAEVAFAGALNGMRSISLLLNGSSILSVGNHGDGSQSGDSEHFVLV